MIACVFGSEDQVFCMYIKFVLQFWHQFLLSLQHALEGLG